MTKIKNWLLAALALALAGMAVYAKFLKKAALKAEFKALEEKEKELVNEVTKRIGRADSSIKRARKLRERLDSLREEELRNR